MFKPKPTWLYTVDVQVEVESQVKVDFNVHGCGLCQWRDTQKCSEYNKCRLADDTSGFLVFVCFGSMQNNLAHTATD